ncbi:type II secretion system protein GspC [Trichloromonas sp.]|uniref:type II secretion system protein GspC n=1 Tax=Trichloromonas sp. TaxID=3069249 RepID=UPI002A3E697D|nr:type II secretion system protein GspC [Trichloromonas sp.]
MLLFLQRHARAVWLLLLAFSGLCLGSLTAGLLGLGLEPSPAPTALKQRPRPAAAAGSRDYSAITQRNIFDSSAPAASIPAAAPRRRGAPAGAPAAVAPPRTDLKLIGTVTGRAEDSLALIMANNEITAYRPGDALPGGGQLLAVDRNVAHIENADGSLSLLLLHQEPSASAASSARRQAPASALAQQKDSGGIRPVAPNRWLIEGGVVEQARGNLGEVLKSARMEPRLVNGATDGFVIAMVRPGSLLTQMGFRKGDVVLQVNGMPLDSPEKALQIFQQLREARSLRVHVERQGQPSVFEYEVN